MSNLSENEKRVLIDKLMEEQKRLFERLEYIKKMIRKLVS
jgi:hypothetical protein